MSVSRMDYESALQDERVLIDPSGYTGTCALKRPCISVRGLAYGP
jgi:hypothetical protein